MGWKIDIKDAPYLAQVNRYKSNGKDLGICAGGILTNQLILTGGHFNIVKFFKICNFI